jgi:hypothetical protein
MPANRSEFLGCPLVSGVEMCVVGNLRSPGEAIVETLAVVDRTLLRGLQELSSTLCEGQERRPRTSSTKRTRLDEAGTSQMVDISIAAFAPTSIGGVKIPQWHRSKRSDSRQQPYI